MTNNIRTMPGFAEAEDRHAERLAAASDISSAGGGIEMTVVGHTPALLLDDANFDQLAAVLVRAFNRAKDQSDGGRFHNEPAQTIGTLRGLGYHLGVADHHTLATQALMAKGEPELAADAVLDAIITLARAVIHIGKHSGGDPSSGA